MNGRTHRAGLMVQSVQVNYRLSWGEVQTDDHLSTDCRAQFGGLVKGTFCELTREGGTRIWYSEAVLEKKAQTKLFISYSQLQGMNENTHKVKNRIKGI